MESSNNFDSKSPRVHRKRQSGPKAEKKQKQKQKLSKSDPATALQQRRRNPKAFAVQHATKTAKIVRRTLDLETAKHHVPMRSREDDCEPPPVVVAIVGGRGVGKSTLLTSLVKSFAKQKLTSVNGPVTVVAGKRKRLTFIECNDDINVMIDVAKVADLVLLMINAELGWDMLLFEFINICQTHGFPKIIGVLNHLEAYKDSKALKKYKKRLKHRFWQEVYQGAKLFYLTKLMHGDYLKNEIHNLGRFISVMKFRPLPWRAGHPYVLCDRFEDATDPEEVRQNAKCDRKVLLYGYVRGAHLRNCTEVHIPGCGDFVISDAARLPDPCPLPDSGAGGGGKRRRSLNLRERTIYAPMSGVGGVLMDRDAVYIHTGGSHHLAADVEAKEAGKIAAGLDTQLEQAHAVRLVSDGRLLLAGEMGSKTDDGVDQQPDSGSDFEEMDEDESSGVSSGSDSQEDEDEKGSSSDVEMKDADQMENGTLQKTDSAENGTKLTTAQDYEDKDLGVRAGLDRSLIDDDDEDDDDDDPVESMKQRFNSLASGWDPSMQSAAAGRINWHRVVYGREGRSRQQAAEDAFEIGGIFRPVTAQAAASTAGDGAGEGGSAWTAAFATSVDEDEQEDQTLADCQAVRDWSDGLLSHLISNCFITGAWSDREDAGALLGRDQRARQVMASGDGSDQDDVEADKDFGDEDGDDDDEDDKDGSDDENGDADGDAAGGDEDWLKELKAKRAKREMTRAEKVRAAREKNRTKKAALKAAFDAEYDAAKSGVAGDSSGDFLSSWKAQLEEQARMNREEFKDLDEDTRAQLEGFRPGLYVRLELTGVPCELSRYFDPAYPLIVGGLLPGESSTGLIRLRFKHHRWYKKILKTRDPLVFSAGWRRFQSMPIYSVEEHNGRHRYLKYTPEHQHCDATIFGPLLPHNTGLLAVQSVSEVGQDFRIAGLGVVLEKDHSVPIMKKLKLIGEPYKIFKKTAFIKGMFSSRLEATKFVGARLQTVSGIRGMVKRPLAEKDTGAVRATFEDRILLSDIVFCRCWAQVEPPSYFNPVSTLLLNPSDRQRWQGARTVAEIRRARQLDNPGAVRPDSQYQRGEPKRKNFVALPLKVPNALQRDLPYRFKPKSVGSAAAAADPLESSRPAVIREPHESRRAELLEMLRAVNSEKRAKQRAQMVARVVKHKAATAKIEAARQVKQKATKKKMLSAKGQQQQSRKRAGGKH
ncbi:hypothetical protein BOX15_Mlig002466g2 [Macrostomum lignano]|uniref:Bms1-type G domain-containing protein n=1 Tax=Macrostomum lignano TaxID=282301 RepID=A0A267F2K7_9PLAT|nr:hypothetical protein BOX15_Mlig002466g2 [Macrostomum lignano]